MSAPLDFQDRSFSKNVKVLLAVVVVACSMQMSSCRIAGSADSSDNSWFVREYQYAAPHDKVISGKQDKLFEVECVDATFADGSKAPMCGWLAAYVGKHLQDGDGSGQINRSGGFVYYHDGMGGRERFDDYSGAGKVTLRLKPFHSCKCI